MQRKLDAASQPYDRLKRPRASPDHHHSAIKTWLSSIPSPASPTLSSSAESMASTTTADATPSLPPSTLRSRSSSPSRNMVYRNQNLRHANVIFTHIEDVPNHVRCAMDTVKRQANATHVEDTLSDGVLRPFYSEVRRLDMESAIETDWRAALKKLLDDLLASHEREVELKVANEREIDWSPELKPEPFVVAIPALIPQKRRATAQDRPPATAQLPTTPTMRSLELKTPRPDIFVAFSERAFGSSADTLLFQLQASGNLVSDPTLAAGLRFPFLVVETKSAATGGTIYQAQNQAAVGGACMLNCLLRLDELSSLADASPSLSPDMPMAFSIATQSNVVELWVHYCDQSPPHTYCMARVATFDCVVDRDNCAAFLRMLAAVLQWGSRELKGWCDERLEKIAANLGR